MAFRLNLKLDFKSLAISENKAQLAIRFLLSEFSKISLD